MPAFICFLQKTIIPAGYAEILGDKMKGGV